MTSKAEDLLPGLRQWREPREDARGVGSKFLSCEVRRPEDAGRVAGGRALEHGPTVRQGQYARDCARGKAFKKSVKEGKTNKSRGIAKCKPRMVCFKCAVRLIQIRDG